VCESRRHCVRTSKRAGQQVVGCSFACIARSYATMKPTSIRCQPISASSPSSRWIFLAAHVLLSVAIGFQYATFAPVVLQTEDVFDVTPTTLNTLILVTSLASIPGIPVAAAVQQKYGPWMSLVLGSVANTLAAFLKLGCLLFDSHSLALMVVSHLLVGVSMVFYLPLPPLIASTWFAVPERTLCTAVASMADSLGNGIGFVTMPFALAAAPSARDGFALVFIAQAVMAVLVLALTCALPSAPTVPPSATASEPLPLVYVMPALKDLVRNRAYLLYTAASTTTFVVGMAIPMFTDQLLLPFGVSQKNAGIMTALFCFCGAAGQIVAGVVTDRTRAYRRVLLVATGATLGLTVLWASTMAGGLDATIAGYVSVPAIGFAFMATLPPMFEFVVELTFPTPLPIAIGCHTLFAEAIVTTVVNRACSAILTDDPSQTRALSAMGFLIALLAVCMALVFCVRDDCRRMQADRSFAAGDQLLRSLERWVASKNSSLSASRILVPTPKRSNLSSSLKQAPGPARSDDAAQGDAAALPHDVGRRRAHLAGSNSLHMTVDGPRSPHCGSMSRSDVITVCSPGDTTDTRPAKPRRHEQQDGDSPDDRPLLRKQGR
jgi:MFS family permease